MPSTMGFEELLEAIPDALVGVAPSDVIRFDVAQRMAAIVDNSNDAVVGLTLDEVVTTWNPAAEWLYGHSSAEIKGKSVNLVVPDDRADETSDILAKIRAGHPVQHLETMRVRNDRTTFPVSLTVSPIRDTDGSISGAVAIARDVTGSVQAQRKIAQQQAKELERLAELERFQPLTVGRELKMIELKKEIEYLRKTRRTDGGESLDQ